MFLLLGVQCLLCGLIGVERLGGTPPSGHMKWLSGRGVTTQVDIARWNENGFFKKDSSDELVSKRKLKWEIVNENLFKYYYFIKKWISTLHKKQRWISLYFELWIWARRGTQVLEGREEISQYYFINISTCYNSNVQLHRSALLHTMFMDQADCCIELVIMRLSCLLFWRCS